MNQQSTIRYRIKHRTDYDYPDPVAICKNQIRMQPATSLRVCCDQSDVIIAPKPTICREHLDYFGNRVVTFSIESIHQSLSVNAISSVTIEPTSITPSSVSPAWETMTQPTLPAMAPPSADEFRYRSPRIAPSQEFARYATPSFSPGRGILQSALELTNRIHRDFKYDKSATSVTTSPEEAFQIKAGVCQDFTHVAIACLRSLRIPARYVSGYLRTIPPPGTEKLVGADESHAWFEVYGGSELGWIGLDPTNACLTSTDHIAVCVGRDYDDVSPMRGVILGGGSHTLKVSVDVAVIR